MFQYNGFTRPENYKNISDFFNEEKQNPNEYGCINDYTKREIPSSFNIKNIGDINKINIKNNLKHNNNNIQNRDMLRNIPSTYSNNFSGVDYPVYKKTNFDENMSNNNINHIANNLSNAFANNFNGTNVNNDYKDQLSNSALHKKNYDNFEFKPKERENLFQHSKLINMEDDPLNNLKNSMSHNTSNNLINNNVNSIRNHIKETIKDTKDNQIFTNKENFEIKWQKKKYDSTSLPEVFGPPMWFTLHNGASKYPSKPSPVTKQRMMYFIMGIPVMIPCQSCREHATAYIEKHIDTFDDICSSRTRLFNFFVDFHNFVNKRLGKREWTYEEAYNLYSGKVEINKMDY
jgi:hypothetical protein